MTVEIYANLAECINDILSGNTDIEARVLADTCGTHLKAYAKQVQDIAARVAALSAFAAFSFSACVIYLTLPDYRYRRRLTNYAMHRINEEPNRIPLPEVVKRAEVIGEKKILKMLEPRTAENTLSECEAGHSLIKMLSHFSKLPEGEHPTNKLDKSEVKYIHWFNQSLGGFYIWFFHSRKDIITCIVLAAIAAAIVSLSTVEFFGWHTLISPLLSKPVFEFFVFGFLVAGFLLPAIFATVGKEWVCRDGRNQIDFAADVYARLSDRMGRQKVRDRLATDDDLFGDNIDDPEPDDDGPAKA